MLQKDRSKSTSKFKFLLVVPLMLAMLTYVACSDVQTAEDTESSLSQYSYTLDKAEGMTADKQKVHNKYEEFLFNNPDYVSWATIDYEADMITYSVHSRSQRVPEGYEKMEVSKKDGREYTMFMNLYNPDMKTRQNQKPNNSIYDGKSEVPFAAIDKAPAFVSCQQLNDEERRSCTSREIAMHVNKNFNTSLGKELGLTGMNRVIVKFRIDETGNIVDIKSRAPHPELEKEAVRIISNLPRMIPGEQNGKPVSVMYSLPIAFNVSE